MILQRSISKIKRELKSLTFSLLEENLIPDLPFQMLLFFSTMSTKKRPLLLTTDLRPHLIGMREHAVARRRRCSRRPFPGLRHPFLLRHRGALVSMQMGSASLQSVSIARDSLKNGRRFATTTIPDRSTLPGWRAGSMLFDHYATGDAFAIPLLAFMVGFLA